MNVEFASHACSHNAAHGPPQVTTITPKHAPDYRKSQITPHELSQRRVQFLWLGMQCLPRLLAPLSLLVRQTLQSTAHTIFEVRKLARTSVWVNTPLKIHAHHSLVGVTDTDVGWTTQPGGTSQGGHLVFIANAELLQGEELNMSLMS